jgi:hypothetical protein
MLRGWLERREQPNGVLRLLETRCQPPGERERHDARLPQKFGTDSIDSLSGHKNQCSSGGSDNCSERLASNSLNGAGAHAECLLSENSKSEINTVDSSIARRIRDASSRL